MGRKQKKLWKHILLFPATCLILLNAIIGCQQSVERTVLPVQQDQLPELSRKTSAIDTATKLEEMEAQLLDQADALIKNGEVINALQYVADSISCCEGHFSGRAFDILRTALAHPDLKPDNYTNAVRCLGQMEEGFPKFGYGLDTGCWVTALGEMLAMEINSQRLKDIIRSQDRRIKTLIKQIEQLKAVDLEPVQPESTVEVP